MHVIICNPRGTRLAAAATSFILLIAMLALPGCGDQKQQAERLVRSAIAHTKADRQVDAVQFLRRATALDPSLAEAFYMRGVCFTKMQQISQPQRD